MKSIGYLKLRRAKLKMSKLKIHGGTSQTTHDLCNTCQHRLSVKSFSNVEYKDCSRVTFTAEYGWPFQVSECSSYLNTTFIPLYELKEIAWHITPEVKERVGFKTPETKIRVSKPGDQGHSSDSGVHDVIEF